MRVEGTYNTADVKVDRTSEGDEGALDQIRKMVDHEAFEGDDDIKVMPDFHWGHGAVIGFTKPLGGKLVPGTVGVDVGCGMLAVDLGNVNLPDEATLVDLDDAIRARVPMGFNVHDEATFHMHDHFPWHTCKRKLRELNARSGKGIETRYGPDYYDELLERVGYSPSRAAQSVGTLGGGNHFIELGYGEEGGELWFVIHSGSRGLGLAIAEHWMERATKLRDANALRGWLDTLADKGYDRYVKFNLATVTDEDLLDWVHGSMGEDFVDYDALKEDFRDTEPERIDQVRSELKKVLARLGSGDGRDTDLDYLEGDQMHGYIQDMIFAQTYAEVNRHQMGVAVTDAAIEVTGHNLRPWQQRIESVHNYIDFRDLTIRKGACRAHSGEGVVIPFNIKHGTLICRGKGNPNWNHSAPHGAGRAMGRRDAKRRFTSEDFDEQTQGVYTSREPIDEIPGAYKDPALIQQAIGPTVGIVDRIVPVLNCKVE